LARLWQSVADDLPGPADALAFDTTLLMRGGQKDLQIRPRAIWRGKNESSKGTDSDQANKSSIPNKIDCMAGS
jgi:hypothetical protein